MSRPRYQQSKTPSVLSALVYHGQSPSTNFFRAARFAFVTPAVWTECHLGVVLSVARRGNTVNNFRIAIGGAPETLTIKRSICRFEWPDVREDEIFRAYCRKNVSCAVRFSEPPASEEARCRLCNLLSSAQGASSIRYQRHVRSLSPLVTTFRAHPALNVLPNRLAYDGTLVNGATAAKRQMLLNIMRFPNTNLPFAFIDVRGTSVQSASHSHYNATEASVCMDLMGNLQQRGVPVASIAIICFYKEQHRKFEDFATATGVNFSTVDSIQGREKDV
ncbi:hypothetical protein ANCCEY_15108, partial [Ancylostoma ceylanicum]